MKKLLLFLMVCFSFTTSFTQDSTTEETDEELLAYLETRPTLETIKQKDLDELYHPETISRNQKPGNRVVVDVAETAVLNAILKLPKDFVSTAVRLSDKNNFSYPEEGPGKPKQKGLAYSWGQKDYKKRAIPPGGGDTCRYSVYGLDCSGFVYNLFAENNIKFIVGPADMQRRPEVLAKYLKEHVGSEHLEVKDLNNLELSEIKSGDIIYFYNFEKNRQGSTYKRATHIGVAYVKPGTDKVYFYNSSGSRNWCEKNLKKGPTPYLLDDGLPKRYGVVRVYYNPSVSK